MPSMAGDRSCGECVGLWSSAGACRTIHRAKRRHRPVQGRHVQLGEIKTRCVLRPWRHRDVVRRCEAGTRADERYVHGADTDTGASAARFGTCSCARAAVSVDADAGSAGRRASDRDRTVQRRHLQLREATSRRMLEPQRREDLVQVRTKRGSSIVVALSEIHHGETAGDRGHRDGKRPMPIARHRSAGDDADCAAKCHVTHEMHVVV
jgi:hypothetical protein